MDERERLLKVIETEGMTAKQFAEEIGVGGGTLSNIAGGRNKPSLEVLQKVLNRFRHINAQWLILGTGTMYVSSPANEPELFGNASQSSASASSAVSVSAVNPNNANSVRTAANDSLIGVNAIGAIASALGAKEQPLPVETVVREVPVIKTIQKIVIFYTDGTFEER